MELYTFGVLLASYTVYLAAKHLQISQKEYGYSYRGAYKSVWHAKSGR